MIFKVAWITEIKSYKKCQAKWDNIAILFSCKVKSSSFSSFKTLDVNKNVSVRLFSKSIQYRPKWPFFILSLCCPSPDTHTVVRHGQCLAKAHYNVMIHKLRNCKKVIFFWTKHFLIR